MRNLLLVVAAFVIMSSCGNTGQTKLSRADSVNIANLIIKSLKSGHDTAKNISEDLSDFFNFKANSDTSHITNAVRPFTTQVGTVQAQAMIDTYQAMQIKPFQATSFLIDAKMLFNYLDSGLSLQTSPIQNLQIILAVETDHTNPNYDNLTFVISTVDANGHHVAFHDPVLGNCALEHCTPCPVCTSITTILAQ